MPDTSPYRAIAQREPCPICAEHGLVRDCVLCDGKGYIDPPLTCAYCFAPRWNDLTVRWLPVRGLYREPYCADTCAVWVMQEAGDANGGAEVWKALVDMPERGDLR